ncbi:MAG TPA: hypothetical protein VK660_06385 [Xanthomonadaceae bacterium]|nr:hypothetical protein [Xanthomonadaceae bacterium]
MTNTDRVASDASAIAAFIAKWRAREPEMAFAEVFCPRPQRARFALWGALLFELREAAFELSDTRPTEVKCAWWADEVLRCAQAAPRHPLTQALAAPQLPWSALASGLITVAEGDASRPADRAAALAAVAPLAEGIARVEAALFVAGKPCTSAAIAASPAVAAHLLCERLRTGLTAADGGRVPLSLLARHGLSSSELVQPQGARAVSDWAAELASVYPSDLGDAVLFRRSRAAFDSWYLRARATGRFRGMHSLSMLGVAWRSARQGRTV